MATKKTAKLILDNGMEVSLPVLVGTEGERAIDISNLRKDSGYITYDNGLGNTGSCESTITFVDGESGVLRYRGYPIEQLAESCKFLEVAHLLIHETLPSPDQLMAFRKLIGEHATLPNEMLSFFMGFPAGAHPMSVMSAMMTSLSSFYPNMTDPDWSFEETTARLLAKVRNIAAYSYKRAVGEEFVHAREDYSYCQNFLNMMFSGGKERYEVNPVMVNALERVLILHADHEQNCSTSAVRLVGSSRANLYAAVGAGISALWGPLHGGASQEAVEMLMMIARDGHDIRKYVEKAKDKNDPFRLMGFGHRVYKNYDPRARILKKTCDEVLGQLHKSDPLLDIAKELESIALKDDYFVSRNLYPNVDFYAGIIYRAMGFPVNMFTVLFTIGRLPGWIAHWRESSRDPNWKIWRPRQLFTGHTERKLVSIEDRVPNI